MVTVLVVFLKWILNRPLSYLCARYMTFTMKFELKN